MDLSIVEDMCGCNGGGNVAIKEGRSEDEARNTARRSMAAYVSWPFALTVAVEYRKECSYGMRQHISCWWPSGRWFMKAASVLLSSQNGHNMLTHCEGVLL